jgi:uncharacterized protein (TIGR03437 family)
MPVPLDLGTVGDQAILQLFGTGLRHASSGSNAAVTVRGQQARVLYSGSQGTFAGLDQLNVRIPPSLASGSADVVTQVDGRVTNTVTMLIK